MALAKNIHLDAAKYHPTEFSFSDKSDAARAFESCLELANEYGYITVMDLYDICGYSNTEPTLAKYGWPRYGENGVSAFFLSAEGPEESSYVLKTPDAIQVYPGMPGEEKPENDPVNHPNHYAKGGIECIKAIEASMTDEAYKGYLKGNILKYLWRYEAKNGLEDLQKARVYLGWLIEKVQEDAD